MAADGDVARVEPKAGNQMNTSRLTLPRAASLVAVFLTVVLAAGCSADRSNDGRSATPSSVARVFPSGSVTVGCALARAAGPDTPSPGSDDLILGPLVFRGLANGYVFENPPSPDAEGVTFFKIGPELSAGSTVTVSIGTRAQRYAGILTEKGPSVGYSSVTFEACSSQVLPGTMFWVGGFTLVGRKSACVPLVVQVAGESSPRHLVLPIETRSCGSS